MYRRIVIPVTMITIIIVSLILFNAVIEPDVTVHASIKPVDVLKKQYQSIW